MTAKDLTLAIDVGTGSVRAALVDLAGNITAFDNREHEQIVPRYGWSEQRPAEWWEGTVASVRGVLAKVPRAASRVAAVAACGQMHGTVLLDDDGRLVRETATLWNDKRAQEFVVAFRERHPDGAYMQITGSPPAPAWPGLKLQWFQRYEPDVYERTATLLMPKDWVNFRLTGARALDVTEASLTFMMDARTWTWSPEMLDLLGVDGAKLPPIRRPTDILGAVTAKAADETALLAGTPVLASSSDFPMALLGSGACRPGRGSDVTGTSSLVTLVGERPLVHPELCNTATPNGLWGAFVIVDAGGDAMRWARRAFHENALDFEAIVAKAGAGAKAGRRRTRPSAAASSFIGTGAGAVAFTGPSNRASSRAARRRATRSSRWIHGTHCRPEPSGPPRPKRKGMSIFESPPPSSPRTKPVRRRTRRTPSGTASRAARSQASVVSARKPFPARLSSVSSSSPRFP